MCSAYHDHSNIELASHVDPYIAVVFEASSFLYRILFVNESCFIVQVGSKCKRAEVARRLLVMRVRASVAWSNP